MKLSKNSKIIRFAYLFSDYGAPAHVSLCKLFWRCVFTALPFAYALFLIGLGSVYAYRYPLIATLIAVIIIIFILLVIFHYDIFLAVRKISNKHAAVIPSTAKNLAAEAFWGIKNRVCPRIEITQD